MGTVPTAEIWLPCCTTTASQYYVQVPACLWQPRRSKAALRPTSGIAAHAHSPVRTRLSLQSREACEPLVAPELRGLQWVVSSCMQWSRSGAMGTRMTLPPELPWRMSVKGQRCAGPAKSHRLQSSCAKWGNRLRVTTCAALCRTCCSHFCWALRAPLSPERDQPDPRHACCMKPATFNV